MRRYDAGRQRLESQRCVIGSQINSTSTVNGRQILHFLPTRPDRHVYQLDGNSATLTNLLIGELDLVFGRRDLEFAGTDVRPAAGSAELLCARGELVVERE